MVLYGATLIAKKLYQLLALQSSVFIYEHSRYL
jgi:predicted GNAT family N-acyltransferase